MSTILVVDDEEHLDILISQKFRHEIKRGDYTFVFARNGRQALQSIERNPSISMVISDINMPEMDGLTLLDQLDKINPSIKTIIISAYNDVESVKAAMQKGAYDFMTKPLNLNELKETLQRLLKNQPFSRQDTLKAQSNKVSLKEELEIASKLQQSLLPQPSFHQGHVDLFASMRAALDIGGDFYDYFWLNPNEWGVVMADVSGKGISAALFMGMARTVIKLTAMSSGSPSECLMRVNRQLAEDNPSMMFVTVFYGILNQTTGEFSYASAGHCPPYLLCQEGCKEVTLTPAPPLGVDEETLYTHKTIILEPRTSFFLYTDGLTEALNPSDQAFGSQRLEASLRRHRECGSEKLIQGVIEDVNLFVGGSPPFDDLTCLAFSYKF